MSRPIIPSADDIWSNFSTQERVLILAPGYDYHEVKSLSTGQRRKIRAMEFTTARWFLSEG